MFGAKARIACLEKGLPIELVMVADKAQQGYAPKHPEVLRVNPKSQVPVLIHDRVEILKSDEAFFSIWRKFLRSDWRTHEP